MRFLWTIVVLVIAAIGVIAMLRAGVNPALGRDRGNLFAGDAQRLLQPDQLPLDRVTKITLARDGEPTLAFERSDSAAAGSASGPWLQVQPFAYPMDPFSVRQLAQQAIELEIKERIDPKQRNGDSLLDSLSLRQPLARVTYEWGSGSANSLTINFGRRGMAGRAYLQIAGDEAIYVVGQSLHDRAIDMHPNEWRDRAIFTNAGVESSQIHWKAGAAGLTLMRDRKQWLMIEPVKTRLDAAALDQYFDGLGRAVVSGFVLDQPSDADLARFGLTDSKVHVTITNGGESQRVVIGARAGGATQDFFAMIEGRPVVVRLSGMVIAALFRQPEDLIALTASGVNPADVKSIVIRSGDGEIRLQRDLEKWLVANASTEVNAAHVHQLLEQCTQLRAIGVEIVQQYPKDKQIATITLHGFDDRALDTVRVIRDAETGRWGMENGDNVLRVYPSALELRLSAADFGLQQ